MHKIVNSYQFARAGQLVAASTLAALLAACASSPMPAPVVDRTSTAGTAAAASLEPAPPGYYRVKRGDTLYRIALENGQSYRDVAGWNNLSNVNQIEVGQLLRIVPPGADVNAAPGVTTTPVAPGSIQGQPLDQAHPAGTPVPPVATASTPPAGAAASAGASAPAADGAVKLGWPAIGQLVSKFDDKGNKGSILRARKVMPCSLRTTVG